MSLGVLNNLSAVYAENNLNNTNNSLSKTLQQLSSGSKINSGADDAAGLSLVDGLEANQTALTQSVTNASEGAGLLQVADGALSQVTTLLNRAVTLATEAANGTLNSSQDTAANQEYQSILSEISNIGSTTTYNNESVFNSNTNIYTGDASSQGSAIDALNIRTLSSSNMGDTGGVMAYSSGANNVFLDLSDSTAVTTKNASLNDSLGGVNQTTSLAVSYLTKGSNGSVVSATANVSAGAGTSFANTVQGLIQAINDSGLGLTASFGTAAQAGTGAVAAAQAANSAAFGGGTDTGIIITGAGVGTGTNGAGEIGTLAAANGTSSADADLETLAGTLSIVGSNGVAHSVTLGTANQTDTLQNLATYVNSQGWGVGATYNAQVGATTNADIVFNSGSPSASVTQSSATLTGTGTGAGVVSLSAQPSNNANNVSTVGVYTFSSTTPGATTGTITVGQKTIALVAGDTTEAAIAATINGANDGVTATVDSTGKIITLTSANSALAVSGALTPTSGTAALTTPDTTQSSYYGVGVTGSVADSSTSGGTAVVGMTTDNNGSSGIATMSYSDAAGQSLVTTDLSNQSDAQSALTQLNTAITDVAAQDGYIGAQINTLNAVSQVISTQQENMEAAQNAVQATDYASASSNMSKYEILSQTGISALAQANSVQQEVTKLLQ
ncbi:MAG: flagellin [Terracidiphilus sp.]